MKKIYSQLCGLSLFSLSLTTAFAGPLTGADAAAKLSALKVASAQKFVPDLKLTNSEKIAECHQQEDQFLALDKELLSPFRTALQQKKAFAAYFANDWQLSTLKLSAKPDRSFNKIELYRWAQSTTVKGAAAEAWLQSYLKDYKSIAAIALDTTKFTATGNHYELTARIDIRGMDSKGWRRQDRGIVKMQVSKDKKLSAIEFLELDTLRRERPIFKDITTASGLGAAPIHLRREAIRRGGYAIAFGDLNGDKTNDLVMGTAKGLKIWTASANGKFSEWKLPALEIMMAGKILSLPSLIRVAIKRT
jgi:hypothetical protein